MQPGLQSGGDGGEGAWVLAPEQGPRILFLSMAAGWDVFNIFRVSSTFSLIRPHDVSKPDISSIATIILQITCWTSLFSCRGGYWPLNPAAQDPVDSAPGTPPHLHHFLSSWASIKKKSSSRLWALNTASDSRVLCTIFGQSRIVFHLRFERLCRWQPTGGTSQQLYVSLPSAVAVMWNPTLGEALRGELLLQKLRLQKWT